MHGSNGAVARGSKSKRAGAARVRARARFEMRVGLCMARGGWRHSPVSADSASDTSASSVAAHAIASRHSAYDSSNLQKYRCRQTHSHLAAAPCRAVPFCSIRAPIHTPCPESPAAAKRNPDSARSAKAPRGRPEGWGRRRPAHIPRACFRAPDRIATNGRFRAYLHHPVLGLLLVLGRHGVLLGEPLHLRSPVPLHLRRARLDLRGHSGVEPERFLPYSGTSPPRGRHPRKATGRYY